MIVDALGRRVATASPPRRVVSLVPSETETVVDLVGLGRIAGRTEYCIEPAGAIETVPTVGGTKSVDVAAVCALRPDLVLANKEENTEKAVRALLDAGLCVHVSFPQTVDESLSYLRTVAELLHVAPDAEPIAAVERAMARATTEAPPVRTFVPIWKDPLMTFDGRTFASDILAWCGGDNVFADRARRYPLAADVGDAEAADAGGRDTRYPRTTLPEVLQRSPALVLLPDEPYRFEPADAAPYREHGIEARFVDGKNLFWYGTRVAIALEALRCEIDQTRGDNRH